MTDKEQIIIDGCNVSGCENYRPKDRFTCYPYICNCHQKPDCHYKQLARKTQECEELKKQLMQKSEVDIFFNTPIEGWSSDPCGICKYKNCLTEIKEIAEPFCNACQEFEPKKNDSNCMYCNYGKILQKISECEVNND